MAGPIRVVLSTNALNIKNRRMLLSSLGGLIGTLMAVRQDGPALRDGLAHGVTRRG